MAHIEKTGGRLPALGVGVGGGGREVGESRGGGGGAEGLVVTPSQ